MRRIGGLRGSALFEGRLGPRDLRAREASARHELARIERSLDQQTATPTGSVQKEVFRHGWPILMASIHERELERLHRDLEALDRRAWRERTAAGIERREQLRSQVRAAHERARRFVSEAERLPRV